MKPVPRLVLTDKKILRGHGDKINAIDFSGDSRLVLAAENTYTVLCLMPYALTLIPENLNPISSFLNVIWRSMYLPSRFKILGSHLSR